MSAPHAPRPELQDLLLFSDYPHSSQVELFLMNSPALTTKLRKGDFRIVLFGARPIPIPGSPPSDDDDSPPECAEGFRQGLARAETLVVSGRALYVATAWASHFDSAMRASAPGAPTTLSELRPRSGHFLGALAAFNDGSHFITPDGRRSVATEDSARDLVLNRLNELFGPEW